MFDVIKPGLETSVQDWPGRLGFWNQGFPPSGPMDSWSFRMANVLVGNEPGAAGLECQFIGPTLRARRDGVVAVTGADMRAKLDGAPMPMWESVAVRAGQTLSMGPAIKGARAYIAYAGGVMTEPWLGARATFHKAGVGGVEGRAIQSGQSLPVGEDGGGAGGGRTIAAERRPAFAEDKRWEVEVVRGPNDDWVDEAGHERFLAADWKLSAKSDRTGFRLDGPEWTFTDKARDKLPEHGSEPSNIIDQGYPCGAINLAGQTPIILVNDGPSMGGFINPYTVPQAAFWKLGQAKPGDILNFKSVSVDEAQAMAHHLREICAEVSVV